MGLAAGQARLLTITARKSDCEYESMRLSHQKIALSRDLAELSNEYQNSINQTKLIYDYYGTGDETTPLSYGLLMTPSTLNDYMPVTLTDLLGRVTLDSKYADAARAAGIPQEGLGTLPSDSMRNAFIQGLYAGGLLTKSTAEKILSLPYNQQAGLGGGNTVAVTTTSGDLNDLVDYLEENCTTQFSLDKTTLIAENGYGSALNNVWIEGEDETSENYDAINIYDLLTNANEISITFQAGDGSKSVDGEATTMANYLLDTFIPWLEETLGGALNVDASTQAAFDYANTEIEKILLNTTEEDGSTQTPPIYNIAHHKGTAWRTYKFVNEAQNNNQNFMGLTSVTQHGAHVAVKKRHSVGSINLNNLAQAYLTLFAKAMSGVSQTDADGSPKYQVVAGKLEDNKLVTDDSSFEYTIVTGSEVSSDDLGQATFYDALFNQICCNGWTENNNIKDNEYLQEMLQNGMLFVSKIKDDGFYYQGNYAADPYIKEITDESAVAAAEAKYNTEKAKLNSKEETIDMKMKNLDTEISSLTTEYDTVKNTISKNIEKSFKRYNA